MKWVILILTTLPLLTSCHNARQLLENNTSFIPYLDKNGQFGFVNKAGEGKIRPEYDDARPFENGVAVVAKGKKYGLINIKNEVVLPLKYAAVEIVQSDRFIFISTKKEYNAWWRFWDWRILPGLNFLGGNSGPFLLTKVPRARYEVQILKNDQKLFSKRKIDHDLGVSYWSRNWEPLHFVPYEYQPHFLTNKYLVIGSSFYKNDKGKWKQPHKRVRQIINDSIQLYQKKDSFYLGNRGGKPISNERFTRTDSLVTEDSKEEFVTIKNKISDESEYTVFQKPVYVNHAGNYFIAPQFSTSFPSKIADYDKDTLDIPGGRILQSAVQIIPWNQKSFLVLSTEGSKEGYKAYFLRGDGHWETTVPTDGSVLANHAGGGLTLSRDGRYRLIHPDFSITNFPGDFIPIWGHPDWYFVKDLHSEKYGIYQPGEQEWLLLPKYRSLETTAEPDVAIYSIEKKEEGRDSRKYGLLDMTSEDTITPPIYDQIEEDGRVREYHNEKVVEFYIDLKTGQEYRDKE